MGAEAIRSLRELLTGISRERIHVELTKLLCGIGAGRVLRAYPDVAATIARLEKEMREAAARLDFEVAAVLRDKMNFLKNARR